MTTLYLDPMIAQELLFRNMGERIRILREELRKEFKNDFTGKSVAARLPNVSQSKLNFIERGETQSIDAALLHSIAKDFGTSIEVFFDDYYLETTIPKQIVLKPYIYSKQDTNTKDISNPIVNPLSEGNYKINLQIQRIASNGDYQIVFNNTTRETHDLRSLKEILTLSLQLLNVYDVRKNENLADSIGSINQYKFVNDLLNHIQDPTSAFPFYPSESTKELNKLYEGAIEYTTQLTNLSKGDETNE